MANTNRPGPTPARRREDAAANLPGTNRGPVPIRRNVENNKDPYIPEESYPGVVVCRDCHAVYQTDRWSLDPRIYEETVRAGGVHHVTCPACQKLHDRQPGGIVTLSGSFVGQHRDEILNLIRNEDARARNVNPLERVMEVEETGNQIVVTTTNEKLAQRLGRAMHRAYAGEVQYQWLDDSKQARIQWNR